jgi:hypothetical protein
VTWAATDPVTIVCWKWRAPADYHTAFTADQVNVLSRMVARHFHHPFRFLCVTDDAIGLDPAIEAVTLGPEFRDVPSPHGPRHPSCYCRLRAFHPAIGAVFGPRFVSLDLDVVITGDVTALWLRPEPFVIYGGTLPTNPYNGSMFLLSAGARPQVWQRFNPTVSPRQAKMAGYYGSDQAWISYCLGPNEARWGVRDGVYSYPVNLKGRPDLPHNARLVVMHGRKKPWDELVRREHAWMREAYQ